MIYFNFQLEMTLHMRKMLIISGLLTMAHCQMMHNYKPVCQLGNPDYVADPTAPIFQTDQGYEIFVQGPLYGLFGQNFTQTDQLPEMLQHPINETFFMRVYADNERGSMYIAAKHKMIQMVHNRKSAESILLDYQLSSCDVAQMVIEPDFPFGYFHGTEKPIHVPFFEEFGDLTQFKIKDLGKSPVPYRGFHGVDMYETCINLRPMLYRLLSELSSLEIPGELLERLLDVPLKITWYWADPTWEMEDGTYNTAGRVPLGIELSTAVSVVTQIETSVFFEITANMTMTMANFHSHYPEHDPLQDLLQVPQGIHCDRRILSEDDRPPESPYFPTKFFIRSESVYQLQNSSFLYNSEEYYDYQYQKFRFDVTLHRPDSNGPVLLSVLQDYRNNVVFTIDLNNRKCKMKPLESDGTPNDDVLSHLMMMPYDILDIHSTNPIYIGKKKCRGMVCHYWTGRKKLTIKTKDGSSTYGIFGIWATTQKWSQNFSSIDPSIMSHFIVKIAVDIISSTTEKIIGQNRISIFDYQLITSDEDIFFTAPEVAFCATEEDPGKMPNLPSRYQYRGEWADAQANITTPIFLNYDASWNVVRFDWSPTDSENLKNRQSLVYDLRANVEYKIDKVTWECSTAHLPGDYRAWDVEPLSYVWPPALQSFIERNLLYYVGVRECRKMACDSFEMDYVYPDQDLVLTTQYQFVSGEFSEISSDIPGITIDHFLARIIHHHWIDDINVGREKTRAVDIFDFTNMRSVFWEYEVVAPCFADVDYKWIRMYLTATDEEALQHVENDIFHVELMEQIRQNASNITPLRIAELRATVGDDDIVVAEFKLRDRHPGEEYPGPSLNDAIQSLKTSVMSGGFTVTTLIPSAEGSPAVYEFTAQQFFEVCADKPCSVPSSALPTVKLDIGALVGTLIGSLIAGAVVIALILTLAISRKHNVPVKDLYITAPMYISDYSEGMTELFDKSDNNKPTQME